MPIPIEPVYDLYGELQEQPFITVVLPCGDEDAALGRAVRRLAAAFQARSYSFEVLVADVAAGLAEARGKYCLVVYAFGDGGEAASSGILDHLDAMVCALDQGGHLAVAGHGIMLRREVASALAGRLRLRGPGFRVELIHLARRIGFRVRRLPGQGAPVGPFRQFLTSLYVRLQDLTGAYDRTGVPSPRTPRESTRLAIVRG